MRIIAGIAKGRRLVAPQGQSTRPMQDRVKEALFSSLGSDVAGADVLDLYAGTGSMGLEALSRAASSCVFVETDRRALAALSANVAAVGLGGTVQSVDAARFVKTRPGGPYDLVFVDPPYDLELASVEAVLIDLCASLKEGATVMVHRRKGEPAPRVSGLVLVDERTYGSAQLWRFEKDLA